MNYATAAAFRTALESRLRGTARGDEATAVRLRKLVSFDRFMCRLVADQPHAWLLKGGFALELRLGARARSTKDIDLLVLDPQARVHELLVRAGRRDEGDWFKFEVESPLPPDRGAQTLVERFRVHTYLDSRLFDQFHLDVGRGDTVLEPPDELLTAAPLAFAGLPPTRVLAYPLTQQIAEKLHAWAQVHRSGQSSRLKDLVDIVLMASLSAFDNQVLRAAIDATFAHRGDTERPAHAPPVPASWRTPYRLMARDLALVHADLESAAEAAQAFLDPVLRGGAPAEWDPVDWTWRPAGTPGFDQQPGR